MILDEGASSEGDLSVRKLLGPPSPDSVSSCVCGESFKGFFVEILCILSVTGREEVSCRVSTTVTVKKRRHELLSSVEINFETGFVDGVVVGRQVGVELILSV